MGLFFLKNKKRTRYYYYLCFISLGGDCVSSFSLIVVGRILSKAAAICGSNLQMMMNGRRHSVGKEFLAVRRLKKKTDHKFLINRQPSCYRPCVVLVRRHLFSNQKLGGLMMSTQVLIAPSSTRKGRIISQKYFIIIFIIPTRLDTVNNFSLSAVAVSFYLKRETSAFNLNRPPWRCITSDEYSQKVDTSIGYADYIQS